MSGAEDARLQGCTVWRQRDLETRARMMRCRAPYFPSANPRLPVCRVFLPCVFKFFSSVAPACRRFRLRGHWLRLPAARGRNFACSRRRDRDATLVVDVDSLILVLVPEACFFFFFVVKAGRFVRGGRTWAAAVGSFCSQDWLWCAHCVPTALVQSPPTHPTNT